VEKQQREKNPLWANPGEKKETLMDGSKGRGDALSSFQGVERKITEETRRTLGAITLPREKAIKEGRGMENGKKRKNHLKEVLKKKEGGN